MKKNLILIFLLLLSMENYGANEMFHYNKETINSALKNISDIENYSILNNYNFEEVNKNKPALIENANLSIEYNSLIDPGEGPLGGSPFIWGFCLGLIGVIVVVATVKGNDKALGNAVLGCVLNGVLIAVIAVLYEVVVFFSILSSEGCY